MGNIFSAVMYHYVRDLPHTRYPRIRGLLTDQFLEQIRFLKERHMHFLTVDEIVNAYHGGKLPENSVWLTFDDGYMDHYTNVLPILYRDKIPAFFSMPGKIIAEKKLLDVNRIHFVLASTDIKKLVPMVFERLDHYRGGEFQIPSNEELYSELAVASRFDDADTIFVKRLLQVRLPELLREMISKDLFSMTVQIPEEYFVDELYMDLRQVRMMKNLGYDWGIHGYDHTWLNSMTEENLNHDIIKALDVFDGIVPRDHWLCCYPYGSVSDEVVNCVKNLGAIGGPTTVVAKADIDKYDIYHIPRLDTNDYPPKSDRYLSIK